MAGADIATLRARAVAGCPEGDLKDAPAPRTFSSAWPLGEPDLSLPMPEPYTVAATGDDDFRVFVLRTNLPEDRWIRAVDFRPGNRNVVHHVIVKWGDGTTDEMCIGIYEWVPVEGDSAPVIKKADPR